MVIYSLAYYFTGRSVCRSSNFFLKYSILCKTPKFVGMHSISYPRCTVSVLLVSLSFTVHMGLVYPVQLFACPTFCLLVVWFTVVPKPDHTALMRKIQSPATTPTNNSTTHDQNCPRFQWFHLGSQVSSLYNNSSPPIIG